MEASKQTSSLRSLSRSTQSNTNATSTVNDDTKFLKYQESFVFPLFSEISRTTKIPSLIYVLQLLVMFVQEYSLNLFIMSNYVWRKEEVMQPFFTYIAYSITLGADNKKKIIDNIFCFIAVFVFFFLVCVFSFFMSMSYNKTRTFEKWQLFIITFFFAILNPVIILPTCTLAGYAACEVETEGSAISIAVFVLTALCVILSFLITICQGYFSTMTPYLSQSMMSSWDERVSITLSTLNAFICFGSALSNILVDWFVIIVIIIAIFGACYMIKIGSYLPYFRLTMSSGSTAIMLMSTATCIISLAHCYTNIPFIVFIAVPLASLIFGMIAAQILNKRKAKRIAQKLQNTSDHMTDAEKKEYFDSFTFANEGEVIMYLHVGIAQMCPLFIDFSFLKHVIDTYSTQKIIFSVLQLATLFPTEQQFLSYCLKAADAFERQITIFERYLVYQVRKVHVIRQSSFSKEASRLLVNLSKQTEETLALLRGYWTEILHSKSHITTASLRFLRKQTNKMNSAYLDAMGQFPKSREINESYCLFLTEVMGDFQGAAKYTKRMSLIDSGRHLIVDHSYRSFVNNFPLYLKEKVLNTHGGFISKDMNSISGTGTYSNNDKSNLSNTSQFEQQCEDVFGTIFTHGKLRVAIQDILKNSRQVSLLQGKVSAIIILFLSLIIALIFMFVLPESMKKPIAMMSSNLHTSKMISSLQYASMIACGRLLEKRAEDITQDTSGNLTLKLICHYLSIKASDLPNQPSFFIQPFLKLYQLKRSFINDLEEELKLIFDDPQNHISEIEILGNFEDHSNQFVRMLSMGRYTVTQMTLRNGIDYYSSLLDMFAKSASAEYDPIKMMPLTVDLILNGILLSAKFSNLFVAITEKGMAHCDSESKIVIVVLDVVVSILAVSIFIIRQLILKNIYNAMNKSSEILSEIDPKYIEQTQQQIFLKKKIHLTSGSTHSGHDFAIENVIYPITVTLSCAIFIIQFILSENNYKLAFKDAKTAFQWASDSSRRLSSIMLLFLGLVAERSSLNYDLNITTNGNLHDTTRKLFEYQNRLDLGIIGKDKNFNEFYYNDKCDTLNRSYNFASYMDCLSIMNKVNIGINYYNVIDREYPTTEAMFFSGEFAGLVFVIDKYIYGELREFQDYLVNYLNEQIETLQINVDLVNIICLVVNFVIFFIEILLIIMEESSYEAFKQLIASLPPEAIVKNTALLSFLAGKDNSKRYIHMTPNETVVFKSCDATLVVDKTLTIQTVNDAVREMTGISSDQLLGQPISFLIPVPKDEEENLDIHDSQFYQQLDELQSCDGEYTAICSSKCISDEGTGINMRATLIKICDTYGEYNGFVLVMKDMREMAAQKRILEEKRLNSERLLEVIVPKGTIHQIRGEVKPVCFYSENSILFSIEIIGLNDIISSVSPSQVLSYLEETFKCINRTVDDYEGVYLFRNEHDMIYGVFGLYDHMNELELGAQEVILFGLDLIKKVEELNEQLNTDIHIKIGAHKSEDVSGYVQKPETPNFKVYSESLYVAQNVERDCKPDIVHVTDSVFKLLKPEDVEYVQRPPLKCGEKNIGIYEIKSLKSERIRKAPVTESAKSIKLDIEGEEEEIKIMSNDPTDKNEKGKNENSTDINAISSADNNIDNNNSNANANDPNVDSLQANTNQADLRPNEKQDTTGVAKQ